MTISEQERRRLLGETEEATSASRFERSGVVASLLGMLAGLGMLVLLTATLSAGAILLNLQFDVIDTAADIEEMSIVGIVIAGVVLLAATMVGGYVAGRTARWGGIRTGIGASLWLTLVLVIFTGVSLGLGALSDTFDGFGLADRLSPFGTTDLAISGALTAGGMFVLALLGGLLGGRLGETREEKPAQVVDLTEVETATADEADTEVSESEDAQTAESPL